MAAAVDVCDAEKCYNQKPVFKKLAMHVPQGKIYGLLGPSGCGKTTLLRCILGRLNLDKGSVLVFGHPPGSEESGIPGPTVGYMAQETTVYLTMTIGEYLRYFGRIFGKTAEQIQSKMEYFIDYLRLPSQDTLANSLSGGQLRLVQFAAASLHDPKLLILDEPTVGVDVILKHRIWEYLTKMTSSNKTSVIITTHYIEEARLADRVGMIHGGIMAAEDSTENLLNQFNETTLEDVFLKICYKEYDEAVVNNNKQLEIEKTHVSHHSEIVKDDDGASKVVSSTSHDFSGKHRKRISLKKYGFDIAWHRLYPIMMRSFMTLYRFPGVLVLLALLPSSQLFMFTQTMGTPIGGIRMIVINEDAGQKGAQYLTYLSPDIIVQVNNYHDYAVGFQALSNGESHGILRILSNFSEVVHQRFSNFVIANPDLIKAGTISIQMDNTNLNIAKSAEFHLVNKYQHFLYDTLTLAGINPAAGSLPINVSQEAIAALSRPPSVFVLAGESVLASYFSTLPIAIFNIYLDRLRGYMEPNMIAGVTSGEIILGVFLVQLVVLVIQIFGLILVGLPVLIGVNKGSIFLIYCLLYVQGIGGTALGIFLSLLCDQIVTLFLVTSGIIFFSAGFAGMVWPTQALSWFFRFLCRCLPVALPQRAMEVIIHRGWDLRYFAVWSAFGISFIWIVVLIMISLLLFYRKK